MSIRTTDTILDRILARKVEEIAAFRAQTSRAELDAAVARAFAPRSFADALRAKAPQAVIAEIKKASPSKGLIREDFDVAWLAERYAAGNIRPALPLAGVFKQTQGPPAMVGRTQLRLDT